MAKVAEPERESACNKAMLACFSQRHVHCFALGTRLMFSARVYRLSSGSVGDGLPVSGGIIVIPSSPSPS